MTSRTAQIYNALVLRNPLAVLALLAAVLIFFGYHAQNFRLDASADSLLLEDDADLDLLRKIHERYPSNALLVVTFTPDTDLFADPALALLKRLRDELKRVDGVATAFTILDAPLLLSFDSPIGERVDDLPNLGTPDIDRARAREELLTSPIYRDLIVSSDGRTAALLLELAGDPNYENLLNSRNELRGKRHKAGLSDQEARALKRIEKEYDRARAAFNEKRHLIIQRIRQIVAPYWQHGVLHLGGTPMIADDLVTFVRNDLIVFGGGVLAFLVIVLAAIFRDWRGIVLPLVTCFYAGLVMIGLLGLIGWKVTVISSNFLALMLIVTISMNIHLTVRYRQLRRDRPEDDQLALVGMTVERMVKPCLYTALTTIIGFGSLLVSGIKPVIDFGWMMGAGLAVAFATSFLLSPALSMAMGKARAAPAPDSHRFPLPVHLARLTETRGAAIMVAAAVLTAVSAAGITQLRVENSFIDYFSDDTEIYRGLKFIDEQLGGTTPLEVLVRFGPDPEALLTPEDLEGLSEAEKEMELEYARERARSPQYWFTVDKIDRIKEIHDYLEGHPGIGKVLSLASTVRTAEASAGRELDGFELALLYTKLPPRVRKSLIEPYVSVRDNEARLLARIVDSNPDLRRKELLETVRRDLVNELGYDAADVTVSGILVLYNNMLQGLFVSQIKTVGVVMLGIAIMFLVLFRSAVLTVIGIVPNLLGAAAVLAFMGLARIPMDMMTVSVAAIAIGIAVDNGIHYIYRFREEYASNGSYVETLRICHSNVGMAVYYTTMTVVFGFSILMLSNFIPTIYFGVLTAAAMFIALVAALTVLPKLILMLKPFG